MTITVIQYPDSPNENEGAAIDMACVRRLFAHPERVTDSAFLRREIAERMHDRLSFVKATPKWVIDAGCGAGEDLLRLRDRFPDTQVLGVDVSPGMLRQNGMHDAASSRVDSVCCDFSRLPLVDGSVGMLWSNLALHWHPNPQQACLEWLRVLEYGGLLMFSCFGRSTFRELPAAFTEVDAYPHELPFLDMHELGNMLLAMGFPSPVLDREIINVTYDDVDRLLADVRAFGGNPMIERRRGLFGRQAWQKVRQALEQNRDADGRIVLSFEVIYVHAFRDEPVSKRQEERPIQFIPRRLIPDD